MTQSKSFRLWSLTDQREITMVLQEFVNNVSAIEPFNFADAEKLVNELWGSYLFTGNTPSIFITTANLSLQLIGNLPRLPEFAEDKLAIAGFAISEVFRKRHEKVPIIILGDGNIKGLMPMLEKINTKTSCFIDMTNPEWGSALQKKITEVYSSLLPA